MSFQFAFIKCIENNKFLICAPIYNLSIFESLKNFVIFVARIYFDMLNILFIKYIFHKKPFILFCCNFIQKYLIKFQIKGISSGEIISFKDRGGQGIDYTHESNRGKRITGKDCDIYVAVDKQVGICYLIPMSFADTLSDDECNKVRLEQVQDFKENWEMIKEMAKTKKIICA